MTHKEALTLALEALKIEQAALAYEHGKVEHIENAITAIKEALAQPEQEPVAKYTGETWCGSVVNLYDDIPLDTLLYTTPPQRTWVGLTDEEMHECAGEYPWTPTGLKCCRAIEAKLKEKNT